MQVNSLGGQDLSLRRGVKSLQDLLASPDRLTFTDEAKEVAAVGDLDAQPTLDLAKMDIELTGEVGKTDVVLWHKPEVEGIGCL